MSKRKTAGSSMRYDPTAKYIRDYMRMFRDRFGIPETRLSIYSEGPADGITIKGEWFPRRCRLCIELEHEAFVTVMFLGSWEIWDDRRKDWIETRWYGGTVMPSDGSGPYDFNDRPIREFLPMIRRIMEIDHDRSLTFDDIRPYIKQTKPYPEPTP